MNGAGRDKDSTPIECAAANDKAGKNRLIQEIILASCGLS